MANYMGKRPDKNLIIGLDVGTSKVSALVGEVAPDNSIEVIGIGTQPSRGLKKGVVVNIESTVQSIQRAIEEAELMAGCEIRSVFAGIAGSHVRSLNSHGVVAIRDREVSDVDVQQVVDAAKAVAIPADQKILHVLPQEFIIDGQEGIRDPIGMSGVRLEAKVHIVTGAESAAQNLEKCIQRCGLEVDDIVLEQLASSFACLTDDERELGVCIIDIGGGTTDLAVFSQGAIRHTAVIPIAGDQVTNDIAVSMRTPTQYAEDIKVRYACALSQLANPDESIEVPSRRRPARAPPRAPDAGRGGRAALRGVVRPGARGTAPLGLRGNHRLGHRAHRRQRQDGRRDRARRGSVPRAGAARRAAAHPRAVRRGPQSYLLDRRGPAAVRARQRARGQPRPLDRGQRAQHGRAHEELVSGELLIGTAERKTC